MTVYTFHAAYDHAIAAQTSDHSTLAKHAAGIAECLKDRGTQRFYLHNGKGVVSAFFVRAGSVHEVPRNDYMGFSPKAKQARLECNLPIED